MRRTGIVYDERCLAHENGSMVLNEDAQWIPVAHVERPERMTRCRQVLEGAGVLARLTMISARPASEDELRLVHTDDLVQRIRDACAQGELLWVGPEARVSGGSWEPALITVGGLLSAVDAVVCGDVDNAYVLLRPCGHHSSADQAMGFCLFNSVAIAARYLQSHHGIERVAIVDWDVHHGNGTQAVFYEDPTVLFVSLHQDDLYPQGWGAVEHTGSGRAEGSTLNVPLPAGSGDAGYHDAFDRVVLPALRAFAPQFILISAGQDPAASDPLGRMSVTTEGFRGMADRLVALAGEICEGRLVAYQEGGYSIDHLPYCTLAIVEALAGMPPAFEKDPMELDVPAGLQPQEKAAVDRALAAWSGRAAVNA